ncbi:hypothetical protein ADILRU_1178 [Leifsonia rubra CMS 76R]|nr:hypothetical protein ADILRU_1178 [Leifsonia rubra CMS 76R]
MRKLGVRASAISLVIALGVLLSVTPASAATGVGEIEVSDDGVTFARSYPGVLFDQIARLSPGDAQSKTVYVRNSGTAPGYLRVTLRDVRYSDEKFGNALTVTTNTPRDTGNATPISSAVPCQVTHEGTLIAPGEIVPVVATLALGNLDGTDGQAATATLALRFALSDSTPGSLPPTTCGTEGITVPIIPSGPQPTRAGTSESSTRAATGAVVTADSTPDVKPNSTGAAQADNGTDNGLLPGVQTAFGLDPNTWRLYQEYLVLILVLAVAIGAGISLFASRHSRKDTHDV